MIWFPDGHMVFEIELRYIRNLLTAVRTVISVCVSHRSAATNVASSSVSFTPIAVTSREPIRQVAAS
ncbi:hypothetical protein Enr13x_74640 [Stieleria neptunia]|uniref:Uncharacterized protein n=1 Tax=Stieleria neptunia TaxID=2527979 RepID=A0A518I3B1_9BACT|nr:hypothetical protein Enr13x_74640 [Stieleria neptunia]